MASSIDLKTYLTHQIAALKQLNRLLLDEQQAVASMNTGKMEELNLQKEEVQDHQRRIIEEGRQAITVLAREYGLPADTTLSRLIERFDQKQKAELLVLQKEAAESATKVRLLANENRGMLERFLGTVNESLGFLLRVLNTSNQYGASGSYVQRSQAGAVMVNRKA